MKHEEDILGLLVRPGQTANDPLRTREALKTFPRYIVCVSCLVAVDRKRDTVHLTTLGPLCNDCYD